jgi:hypothetical protein
MGVSTAVGAERGQPVNLMPPKKATTVPDLHSVAGEPDLPADVGD